MIKFHQFNVEGFAIIRFICGIKNNKGHGGKKIKIVKLAVSLNRVC